MVATTYSKPGYDSIKDFAPITALVSLPNVMIVQANKYKTLKDFVDYAKANPGKMNYASAGAGSAAHLNGERFRLATGTQDAAHPLQGRAGGRDLGDDRRDAISISFRCRRRAARSQTGKLAILAVSGSQRSASLAGRADHGRGRLPELRIRFLGRLLGARRDAAGHRRQAQRRDTQGAGGSRR